MATEHAAPAYHHFQHPPHFSKQSQGVFVASTRLNCTAMDLQRDPAQLPNSIQVHARRKSVPYTGSFRRSNTAPDVGAVDCV